jgi:hypothetical protein
VALLFLLFLLWPSLRCGGRHPQMEGEQQRIAH